jgi:dTDP-4-dehydrorhamnose reductase
MAENTVTLQHVLGTGLNGLVGSKFVSMLCADTAVVNLDVNNPIHPVDITNAEQVLRVVSQSPAPAILHMAAFTDVTKAWEQRGDTNGAAYRVNVVGTQNLVAAAVATGKHLIHISTAYVFDGKKEGLYLETDTPCPIEWYGETKARAETAVTDSQARWTIFRIDQPFRSDPFPKKDIVHRILDGLQSGTLYPQFADHTFGPTYIDDFAHALQQRQRQWLRQKRQNKPLKTRLQAKAASSILLTKQNWMGLKQQLIQRKAQPKA